jgi:hypothetical protein
MENHGTNGGLAFRRISQMLRANKEAALQKKNRHPLRHRCEEYESDLHYK